jgi:protein-tyrosine phosphatase
VRRAITWGGLPNAWDLGGLPLRSGGQTVFGRIFRSGRFDALDASGWNELLAAGVTTLVDLRNDSEVRDLPQRPAALTVHRTPVEDEGDEEFMAEWAGRLGTPRYYPVALSRWPDLFRSPLEAIASTEGGIVIHCSAGRDRTGLLSALLLETAGVERAAILDDYVAGVRAANSWLRTHPAPHETAVSDGDLAERIPGLVALLDHFLDGDSHTPLRPVLEQAASRLLP